MENNVGFDNEARDKTRTFILETFLFGDGQGLEDDTSLLDEGIIDSTGVLELVNFIEEEFSVRLEDEELLKENLDSINNVVRFLEGKMQRVKEEASDDLARKMHEARSGK